MFACIGRRVVCCDAVVRFLVVLYVCAGCGWVGGGVRVSVSLCVCVRLFVCLFVCLFLCVCVSVCLCVSVHVFASTVHRALCLDRFQHQRFPTANRARELHIALRSHAHHQRRRLLSVVLVSTATLRRVPRGCATGAVSGSLAWRCGVSTVLPRPAAAPPLFAHSLFCFCPNSSELLDPPTSVTSIGDGCGV
jgi:hypothetical protein